MSLAGFVINFMTKGSARRFEEATKNPAQAQTDKILNMVRKNADTEYGRRYGFSDIRTIKDFQKQVPVVSYVQFVT